VSSLPWGADWSLSATTGTDGKIYVMGGLAATGYFYAYNPATQTWARLPDLPNFAGYFYSRQATSQAATGKDGTIYAIGGIQTDEVDAYNPVTQTWTQVASLPSVRSYAAVTTGADGAIYFIGGANNGTFFDEVDAYNPQTNTWAVLPPMPGPRYGLAAATGQDGTIYAIGGASGIYPYPDTTEVDAYNPVTRTWTVLGQSLPNPREVLSAATGADGTIYAMGGEARDWSNEVDTYLPPGRGANTATVADAPLSAAGTTFSTPGVAFADQTVATFTDPGGAEPLADYYATISWGDSSYPDAGEISYDPGTGQFSVLGSHTYPQVGTYAVSVSIQHESAPTAAVTTAAQIGSVRPTASITGPDIGVTGQLLGFTVGATDPIPSLDAAGFAFTINWGDGSQAASAPASAGNGSGVSVGHSFAAGTYTVVVTATDQSGNTATSSVGVTVAPAATGTTIGVSSDTSAVGQSVTFTATVGAVPPGAGTPTGTVTFSEGGVVIGTGILHVVDGVDRAVFTTAALGVGGHTITAAYGGDGSYSGSVSGGVSVTVIRISTTTALTVSASAPLAGVDAVDLQATVAVDRPGVGGPTGSVDFFDATTGTDLGSSPVLNGVATLRAGPFTAGPHSITATYGGDATFGSSAGTAVVTALAPASLSGSVFADFNNDGQVDFGEAGIGGVLITLTGADDLGQAVSRTRTTDGDGAYVFLNLRPGSYYLTEAGQPSGYGQGVDTMGTAGGQLSSADQFTIALNSGTDGFNYNFGETPAATGGVQHGQTAGIGFWNNRNGQALIRAFNGGTGHQLGDWLAATFVNLYGANSANDLAGRSNAYIAALFQQDFLQKGQKLDAQVLATALSVYATSATLDATRVAAQYGFTVAGDGVGTATINVGADGAAFGATDGATMTVLGLLLAADARAVHGVLYGGDATLRNEANDVFSLVNQAGAIS